MKATYSVPEAAEILGIAKGTLYHLCQRGAFPSVRLGRRVVIPRHALAAVLPPEPERQADGPVALDTNTGVFNWRNRVTAAPLNRGTNRGTTGPGAEGARREALRTFGFRVEGEAE